MPEIHKGRYVVNCGWDDVPHLSADVREKLMDSIEPHMVGARTRGEPVLGVGRIYPVDWQAVSCEPFPIPDHWPRCYALDTGWGMTAALWAAWDRDSDTVYVYAEYYRPESPPHVHAHSVGRRGIWIPGVFDPSARNRKPDDGRAILQDYIREGLDLAPADNAVESGIHKVVQRLSDGTLLFFAGLSSTKYEFVVYRRDKNSRVLKEDDHLMDCLRYIVSSGLARSASRAESMMQSSRWSTGHVAADSVAGF